MVADDENELEVCNCSHSGDIIQKEGREILNA